MKIVVFGATGGTGKQVVERALAAGHEVIAVARKPEAVAAPEAVATKEHLTVRKGDVLDAASVKAAVAGADAAICAIGPAKNSDPGTLISQGARNMVEACEAGGVKRLAFESGMMVSDGAELSFLGRMAVGVFGLVYPKLKADKVVAEATITASTLDWVIVRPPALTHGEATGNYLAGPRASIMPAKSISHADCAEVLVKAVAEAAWVKQVVDVGRA